jgi:hypothetical protein
MDVLLNRPKVNVPAMKKRKTIIILLLSGVATFAQQKTPESTELYSPVPPVVTPGEGTRPPSDAIILFDGSNLNQWVGAGGVSVAWTLSDGCMIVKPGTGNIETKRGFGDCQLHIEWRCPSYKEKKQAISSTEQGFGNSGILLQSRYATACQISFIKLAMVNMLMLLTLAAA